MVRFKNRYILVQIKSDKSIKINQAELTENLKKSVQKYFGDFGAASIANIGVRYFHEQHKLLIIRISHGPHRFLTSILPLMTKAGNEIARYRILYVGATIRQCKKRIITHQNDFLKQTVGSFEDSSSRLQFLKELSKSIEM